MAWIKATQSFTYSADNDKGGSHHTSFACDLWEYFIWKVKDDLNEWKSSGRLKIVKSL
jgi:hypothetical protein